MEIGIALVFMLVAIVLGVLWIKEKKQYQKCIEEYSGIEDIKEEVKRLEEKIVNLKVEYKKERQENSDKIDSLKVDYREKMRIYNNLKKEIVLYDEEIELVELGLYKPYLILILLKNTNKRFYG